MPETIRLLNFDLNWSMCPYGKNQTMWCASAPNDWAFIDPVAYVDWHEQHGNNTVMCQAYTQPGTALYPSKLGQNAPAPGNELCLKVAEETTRRDLSFWSYFSVGCEALLYEARPHWALRGSKSLAAFGDFFAPESPWTELLCNRIREFLTQCPQTDWLLLDWFDYGSHTDEWPRVNPEFWFVQENFERICGRPAPERSQEITDEEDLLYKRTVLAEQFYKIRDAVKQTNPDTKIMFNVPYYRATDPRWVDHPMVLESDGLFSESTKPEVMEWLLKVKRPEQRLMTTIAGLYNDPELCKTDSWREWHARGCDFFAYVWGVPPEFKLHESFEPVVQQVKAAFEEIEAMEQGSSVR